MRSLVLIISLLFAFASTQGQGAMFLRGSQPAPQPGAGILDSYTGAAFAAALDVLIYSSHSVTDNTVGSQTEGQTGPYTVLVRRDNDDALRSFTYTEVSDGTLTTWVGPANNGFVQILYDQSTNGNHANQTNTANMPKLVDAVTGLVVENGKAAMQLDGSNDFLQATFQLSTPLSLFAVLNEDGTNLYPYVFGNSGGDINDLLALGFLKSSNTVRNFIGGINSYTDNSYTGRHLYTSIMDSANSYLGKDGIGGTTTNNATGTSTRIPLYLYINSTVNSTTAVSGYGQFVVCFLSNQSANRPGIETAINTEYSIY